MRLLHLRGEKVRQQSQVLKGKKEQINHKGEEASANREWMDAAGGKKLLLNFFREMDCQSTFWETLLSWFSIFENLQFSRCIVMDSHFPNNRCNSGNSCFTSTFTLHFVRSLLRAPSTIPEVPLQSSSFLPYFHFPGTIAGEDSGRASGQPTEKAGQRLHCSW